MTDQQIVDAGKQSGLHSPQIERLLTPEELAEILRVEPCTLAGWRCRRIGPEYVKIGRLILYRPEGVDAYILRTIG